MFGLPLIGRTSIRGYPVRVRSCNLVRAVERIVFKHRGLSVIDHPDPNAYRLLNTHTTTRKYFEIVMKIPAALQINNRINAKTLAIALGLAGLIAVSALLPVKDYTVALLSWIENMGVYGYAIFTLAYIGFTVLFLPGFILTLGAGAVFGLLGGFFVVVIGGTTGACLAFLLGRFFARDWVATKVEGSKRFSAIDRAVGDKGWKIVFLTRLSPVFPFNLINYAYGLTKISFPHYALATLIGMLPGIFVYVYIGALAGDVARAAAGEQPDTGGLTMAMQGVGLLATIAVTFYITKLARQALQQAVLDEETDSTAASSASAPNNAAGDV